ncbi:uncharacterized protein LAESUDRAFT_655602 [Laetiporus sulphureus 93-53]|uniref:F-box domain-containing protein n=1 Tax=Laetiporus sulphureus 93-53 TaxID=1314785 RepID=A0A165DUQ8_9APHY|nr:uncharacterized protein LAESUDRAFT_655602 [Laetiporus sulphureus 93-53]KZT05668.1 hypothetical protein LAESUDRAFT_655602 [Laetiporus sulphureus 93-53]
MVTQSQHNSLESLPVELIADTLSELDLSSLVTVSNLSQRLRGVSSDPSLNPWRRPILRTLRDPNSEYDPSLKHLSVRSTVPRQNFIEVLSLASARYLLYEASLPNLRDSEWEECFRRRFLPGWEKIRKDGPWKEAFLKSLYRVWHRTGTACTVDEAWTKYIVLNKNGTANEVDSTARNFDPLHVFEEMRFQNDLLHLQPSIRVLCEFTDVRMLAIGVLHTPRASFGLNNNARALLHPPGIEKDAAVDPDSDSSSQSESESGHTNERPIYMRKVNGRGVNGIYRQLTHPSPAPSHKNYPFYTPGGKDNRWMGTGDLEETGQQWVGSMMIIAQYIDPHTKEAFGAVDAVPPLQDRALVEGLGPNHYTSLTFADLNAIAPWLETTKQIEGPGLGHAD